MGGIFAGEKREEDKREGLMKVEVEDAMPHRRRLRHFSRPGVERRFSASRFIDASRGSRANHRRPRLYIRARATDSVYRSFNRPATRTLTTLSLRGGVHVAYVRCTPYL